MTRFCLVRHGKTDWNIEGRYTGQSDVPLNQAGIVQANLLARKLKRKTFAAIYSSDLSRAKDTAACIAESIHLPVVLDSRLREINQGEWEGLHVDIIKERYDALWRQRSLDPANVCAPGGETVGEVAGRVYAALDDISVNFSDSSVLIVSHGLALAAVLCKVNGIPIGKVYQMIPDNVSPIWVDWRIPSEPE